MKTITVKTLDYIEFITERMNRCLDYNAKMSLKQSEEQDRLAKMNPIARFFQEDNELLRNQLRFGMEQLAEAQSAAHRALYQKFSMGMDFIEIDPNSTFFMWHFNKTKK